VPELNVTRDPLHPDCGYLRDVYRAEQPDYNGRFSVPLLYDKVAKRIVNNESEDIIRMLYHEFDNVVDEPHKSLELYPEALRKDIDESNKWIYDDINNGVYKSGFAQ
jgi:putative glutathione S-transferase